MPIVSLMDSQYAQFHRDDLSEEAFKETGSIKRGSEYVHPFVSLMMMLLFEFLYLRASLSATLLFDLLFDLHRFSNPFLENKCSPRQQFKILSARLKKYLLQVLQKFHGWKFRESQRVSQVTKTKKKEKNELNCFFKKLFHSLKDAIHQSDYFNHPLFLFIFVFLFLSLSPSRPVVCSAFFTNHQRVAFLKCALQ
jgi:hypothetical protein